MRFLLILALAFGFVTPAAGQKIPQSKAEISLSFAPVVKQTAPAVVNIFANRIVAARTSPFRGNTIFQEMFRQFEQPRPRVQNSLGSGVILSEDGIVVSNYHVVGMATEIRVVLKDRREFQATVLLADEEADLAILKIEADSPLPWLTIRDSDQIEVGELVLAIGNPFGIGQTVSSGIISGLARSGIATGNARGYFIQTDAAINPGNSGGALVDMAGNLVGVNTSILTRSGGSNGIGFAIPSNLVARFVDQARNGNTSFAQPWAGITGQAVDFSLAEGFGLTVPEGVVISSMHPASPLAAAGLVAGDIVLSVDGQTVNAPAEMIFRMSIRPIGETIEMEYLSGGDRKHAEVSLIEAPEIPARKVRLIREGSLAGLTVSNINPAVSLELRLSIDAVGIVVANVVGPLARLGLRPGDVIQQINGIDVQNTGDVASASSQKSPLWRIVGQRGRKRFSYRFRL